ncbi:MAG TPA: glutamine synthetase III, partial [Bacteroidales bacterium]
MAILRFNALNEALSRKPIVAEAPRVKTSDYFGISTFDRIKMQKYLSKEAYQAVIAAVDKGQRIDRKIADQVAAG